MRCSLTVGEDLTCHVTATVSLVCIHRDYSTVDLPLRDPSLVVLVVDTSVRHSLVDGEYNARRESCMSAASKLGKSTLRDATMADLDGK